MSEFLASRRGKMFGIAEVIALAGSCLVLALVLLSYLYFLVPTRSRLSSWTSSASKRKPIFRLSAASLITEQDTKQKVDRIAASLTKFETEHLLRPGSGPHGPVRRAESTDYQE